MINADSGTWPPQAGRRNERVMPTRLAESYRSCMDTKTFKITTTVRDEDVQTTKEQLQAMVDALKARVPEAIVSEMTMRPAPDDRLRPLCISEDDVD